MTWTALDSVGQPDPNAAHDLGYSFVAAYVGTQYQRYGTNRPYIDRCLGAGIGFLPIFEEWSSQFLGGYDVARQMMGRMRAGWDALGLPNDGSCCPAIALVDPNPGAVPGNEGALIDFARGVEDSCWLPSWTGYGSKYGLDVVRGHVPRMQRRWGVGTWGFGERGDGSLPPNVDADMIQHGNKHAQLPGCDENTVFTEWMGQLGGVAPTPPEEPKGKEDMWIALILGVDGNVHAYGTDGCVRVIEFGGPPGAYGIPQEALDSKLFMRNMTSEKFEGQSSWDRLLAAEKNALTAPSSGGGGGGGGNPDKPITAFTDPEFLAEYDRRVKAGAITPVVQDT